MGSEGETIDHLRKTLARRHSRSPCVIELFEGAQPLVRNAPASRFVGKTISMKVASGRTRDARVSKKSTRSTSSGSSFISPGGEAFSQNNFVILTNPAISGPC